MSKIISEFSLPLWSCYLFWEEKSSRSCWYERAASSGRKLANSANLSWFGSGGAEYASSLATFERLPSSSTSRSAMAARGADNSSCWSEDGSGVVWGRRGEAGGACGGKRLEDEATGRKIQKVWLDAEPHTHTKLPGMGKVRRGSGERRDKIKIQGNIIHVAFYDDWSKF